MSTSPLYLLQTTGSGQPQVDSFGSLKTTVARVINGETQAAVKAEAGRGIQRGIDDINMRHLFDFASDSQSDATLTAGTATYALPNNFFAMREVQLVDTSSEVWRTLDYVDWDHFNRLLAKQDKVGIPTHWTAPDPYGDGTIRVYPNPDAGAAADYTLRLVTYQRVAMITGDSDIIAAPRELSDVLCTYGEYHLLFWSDNRNQGAWGHKLQHYRDKLAAFKGSDGRHRNELKAWTMGYETNSNAGVFDPLS